LNFSLAFSYQFPSITVSDASQRYPYFDTVVGLVWSYDPESYADGSVASGRASNAGQGKGDDPEKKGYPCPPGWTLGGEASNPRRKKIVTKPKKHTHTAGQGPPRGVEPMMMMMITSVMQHLSFAKLQMIFS
jgi:hypothetical protein